MRIESLQVEKFRGIGRASILFGAGLTVLYGTNELGKSTLAEAIRAALFVPTTSKEGASYVRWGAKTPACVTVVFEHGGKLWKVAKRYGPLPRATLERSDSLDAPVFFTVAEGNNVEGTLRELLSWGIAAPGGKGAPPKPVSFLHTTLLGRQGEVESIFGSGLDEDKDHKGKALVTQALGALAKDPVVARIVDKLTKRVEESFTATGQLKKATEAPLVRLQEGLKRAQTKLDELRVAHANSEGIRARVLKWRSEQEVSLTEEEEAVSALADARACEENATKRMALQATVAKLTDQLAEVRQQERQLNDLTIERTTVGAARQQHARDEKDAAAVVVATNVDLQLSKEAVAHASAAAAGATGVAEATKLARIAQLEASRARLTARLGEVSLFEGEIGKRKALEIDLGRVRSDVAVASERVVAQAQRVHRAEVWDSLRAAEGRRDEVSRLTATHDAVLHRVHGGEDRLRRAEDAVAAATASSERCETDWASPVIEAAVAERGLLLSIEYWLDLEGARAKVAGLEALEGRARDLRNSAARKRSEASRLEEQSSSRPLPSRHQVEAWRVLQTALAAPAPASSAASRGVVGPLAVGGLAGGLAAVLLIAVLDQSVLVGSGVGVLVGGLAWFLFRSTYKGGPEDGIEARERRRQQQERWEAEVAPALAAAGLPTLATWEVALASVVGLKAEAGALRADADRLDQEAVAAEKEAAGLDGQRTELSNLLVDAPTLDRAALETWRKTNGADLSVLRTHVEQIDDTIESERGRLRFEAAAELQGAEQARASLKTELEAIKSEFALVAAKLSLATQQHDPEEVARLRERMDGLGASAESGTSRDTAAASLEEAKHLELVARERRRHLEQQLEALDGDAQVHPGSADTLAAERRTVEAELADIELALGAVNGSSGSDADAPRVLLESAMQRQSALEERLAGENQMLVAATTSRTALDLAIADLDKQIASRSGALASIDLSTIQQQVDLAATELTALGLEVSGPSMAEAKERLTQAQRKRELCTTEFNQAKGQLQVVAGNVGADQLARQEELVTYMTAEVSQREAAERAAYRLLTEISRAEAEQSMHLGRVLAGPVAERFRGLTQGRYTGLGLDVDLRTQHVEVGGAARELDCISVGTREQLATLMRLAIAEHLKTTVILDDQLVHSDTARLEWFRATLRQSALTHQIVVFTCRARDYLGTAPEGQDLLVVDLSTVVSL